MSSINKKQKYDLLFKSIDAGSSDRGSSPAVSVSNRLSNRYTNSSMVQHSPRFLGLSEPNFRNPYNNIFDRVESPEIRSPSVVLSSMEPRTKLHVGDLYKRDSISSRTISPTIPPLHLQKMPAGSDTGLKKRPQMRLKPVPKPPVASANVDSVLLSSPRKQKVRENNSSRTGLSKDNSVPNISTYLQYLEQKKEASNEKRIKQKLGAPADPKTIKSNHHESSALELHSPLINMLTQEVRSRMDSALDMSLNLNNKDLKTISIENVKDAKDPKDVRESKSGESSPKKLTSLGTLSKVSSGPFKIKTKFSFGSQPDVQSLFKQIALNLHEVHKWNINERRFAHIIEVLADKNTDIVQLVMAKWHKVHDYDPARLEQKFALVEVLYEPLPITVKLQKKQQGIKLIDASLLGPLQIFNTKMEEYCVAKKTEALKLVEYSLEEAKFHLEEYGHKKASNLMKKGKVAEYYNMKMSYDNTLRLPYCVAAESDPTEEVEKYQRNHLDYKHIKRGNLEYSHNISEVFHEWSKYGMSYGH